MVETLLTTLVLGVALPASDIRVPTVPRPVMFSVQYFDNLRNVSNRVLDRSIRADVVRVHTDLNTGEVATEKAKRNQESVEEHCKTRFLADGLSNATKECGPGFARRRN